MPELIPARRITPEQYIEDIDRRIRPDQLKERTRGGQKPWCWLRLIDADPNRSVPLALEAMLKVVMVNEVELGLEIYGLPPERDGEEISKYNMGIMDSDGIIEDPDVPRASGYLLDDLGASKHNMNDLNTKVPVMV